MTAARMETTLSPPEERITVEDLKHKALAIQQVATEEVKRAVGTSTVRAVLVGAAVVAIALSLAYYVGSRTGAKAAESQRPQ